MRKIGTVQAFGNEIFKEQKLTIGLDLGDLWSFCCVRDEAGYVILEGETSDYTGSDEADIFEDSGSELS
jgi:hypothetical protein